MISMQFSILFIRYTRLQGAPNLEIHSTEPLFERTILYSPTQYHCGGPFLVQLCAGVLLILY